jgi:hypothetical protein
LYVELIVVLGCLRYPLELRKDKPAKNKVIPQIGVILWSAMSLFIIDNIVISHVYCRIYSAEMPLVKCEIDN